MIVLAPLDRLHGRLRRERGKVVRHFAHVARRVEERVARVVHNHVRVKRLAGAARHERRADVGRLVERRIVEKRLARALGSAVWQELENFEKEKK